MADPGAPPAIGTMCFDTADHLPSALCTTPVKPAVVALGPGTALAVYPSTCFGSGACDSASPRIPAYIVQAKDYIDPATGVSAPDRFWLISTACIPGPAANPCPFDARAAAQVQALLVQTSTPGPPTIPVAVFGASTTANPAVKISSGGALVDSFDSRGCGSPPCNYTAVAHGSNGDIMANGGIDIKGTYNGDIVNLTNVSGTDVKIESGTTVSGNLTYGGAGTYSNSGSVSGTITQQANQPKILGTLANCGPYPASMDSVITQYDGSGNVVPQSKWTYSNGALNISTGAVGTGWVSMAPGNYCLASLVASGGSLIKISDLTVITSNGEVNMSGGSFANLTNDAQNLQIISTYGNDAGETHTNYFVLSGGSGAYMVAYAPYTKVTISGSGAIYGAVIGNTVEASGGSSIHYDECLGKPECATKLVVGIPGDTTFKTYSLAKWRQFTCRQTSPSSPWSCS